MLKKKKSRRLKAENGGKKKEGKSIKEGAVLRDWRERERRGNRSASPQGAVGETEESNNRDTRKKEAGRWDSGAGRSTGLKKKIRGRKRSEGEGGERFCQRDASRLEKKISSEEDKNHEST